MSPGMRGTLKRLAGGGLICCGFAARHAASLLRGQSGHGNRRDGSHLDMFQDGNIAPCLGREKDGPLARGDVRRRGQEAPLSRGGGSRAGDQCEAAGTKGTSPCPRRAARYSPRTSPMKNRATVPGPVCEPITVPMSLISTLPASAGKRCSTRSRTRSASSRQALIDSRHLPA